jgi:translocation and assembly module TamB
VTGSVPLSLGNRQLASRGAALRGELNVDLSVTGTTAAPQIAGRITSEGGGFVDPETGIVLRNLSLVASVADNRLTIDRLTAQSGEGTLSASGSVGLADGFPVDVRAEIRQARYVDGTVVTTRFDADLTMTGSLATGPVLGGSVFLDRTEITVPEQLPRDSVAVDVEHVRPPSDVAATLGKIRERGQGNGSSGEDGSGLGSGGGSTGVTLDVTIKAPQQIFVRGRGLDAELGGELRLTGPLASAVADGNFEMRRGRLDIFTQRITFSRGVITFAGDLDPVLDFSGSTQSEDVVVTVSVAGQASDPEVTFSSVPELPQDEVLAHLIFEKGLDELSPVQIARLADAAAGLGGGGGLLNQLRASTGLDDLDIVTDEEGAPAVAAGRYVSENVYLGVQGGTSAESSRVTIDLDITDDVKARAAVTPQGNSSLGVFFEREY